MDSTKSDTNKFITFDANSTMNIGGFSALKKPVPYYVISFIILLLILIVYSIFFNNILGASSSKSQQQTTAIILATLIPSLLIVICGIMFLPSLVELKNIFIQIGDVTYVILFTIAAILFYTLISKDVLINYSNYINPLILALGIFVFYKTIINNYIGKFNINYERIKMLIIFVCFIALITTFYSINPGNMATNYFGYSLLLISVISIFAFLYIIVLLSMPDGWSSESASSQSGNLLSKFSPFGVYGSILFFVFLVITASLISFNKKEFFSSPAKSSSIIILILIISILWIIMLCANLFSDSSVTNKFLDVANVGFYKKALLAIFGIIISGLIIYLITYNIENLSGKSGITHFLLNIILVIIVLGLIYKTINVRLPVGNAKKNAFFSLIINILLYIPCLVSGTFDSIGKTVAGEYRGTETGSIIMLIVAILLFVIYFKGPSLANSIYVQGGKQLVNQPVYTDTEYNLGNYIKLNNGSDTFDYEYAISFWVYLDAVPPNMNENYNKYTSLLNFGNKPNILYNGKENTLMITMQQKDLKDVTKNTLIDFDDEGNRIIYTNKNFLLQKWNNIIINYNGGTMDIFLNGELVKSSPGVVPHYTIDNLNIGENGGIKGGICNVIYFGKVLNSSNIYTIYNSMKDREPPVINPDSNKTIV